MGSSYWVTRLHVWSGEDGVRLLVVQGDLERMEDLLVGLVWWNRSGYSVL